MRKEDSYTTLKFIKRFETAADECSMKPENRYLVGVSGGVDSMVLLSLLTRCEFEIVVAHLNHSARATAERDSTFVARTAEKLGVTFIGETVDVPGFAEEENLSFEEAARIARYRFLLMQAEAFDCDGVIVGHHADDQVETVLMHLLRGSGIAGLSGMKAVEINPVWSKDIPIIRPLSGFWRYEILEYAKSQGVEFIEDESNTDIKFYRNRLRHELIPHLESYNSGVKQHLFQTAQIAQDAEKVMAFAVSIVWDQLVITQDEAVVICDYDVFLSQDCAMQRLLIRELISTVRPESRDFDYGMTVNTQRMILNPPEGGEWQINSDLAGLVFEHQLLIGSCEAVRQAIVSQYPQGEKNAIDITGATGEITLNNGYRLQYELSSREKFSGEPWKSADSTTAFIDFDCCFGQTYLRSYEAGDWFSPLGMPRQRMKIADYFIDHKIQHHARKKYPVVCDQNGIVWLVGERLSEKHKITEKTQWILRFELVKR